MLTLGRPDALYPITVDLLRAVGAALDGFGADRARALVLTGRGRAFCAGADVDLVRSAFDGDPSAALGELADSLHAVIRRLRRLPFPVVAAVEGAAVGAGMGLALAADLRVVTRPARFVPGYLGMGASPDVGVSCFLAGAVGGARALSLIVRNRVLGADDLLAAALAKDVVADGGAAGRALELARTLTGLPPLQRTRDLIDRATTQSLSAQLDTERRLIAGLWATADFREGVGSFLDKRIPLYEGR